MTPGYFAYVYARRHVRDERFSFGADKVNALAGFTGAILLAVFALTMAWERAGPFVNPVAIRFDQAIYPNEQTGGEEPLARRFARSSQVRHCQPLSTDFAG